MSSTANGVTTNYVIDPFGLGNVIGTYDGSGNLIANYTYGLGLVSQTTAAGSASYYAFDAIGSTSTLTNSAGTIVNSYAYDPFGNSLAKSESVPNPFQFVGCFGVMADTDGLQFMRARYYSNVFGRFTSSDPLGIVANVTDVNLYRYSGNAPVTRIDPQGLQSWGEIIEGVWGETWGEVIEGVSGAEGIATLHDIYGWGQFFLNPDTAGAIQAVKRQGQTGTMNINEAQQLAEVMDEPFPTIAVGGGSSTAVTSHDPNAEYGPAGYGPQGFISDSSNPLPYQVDFENDPTATAPAQEVTVTDQLDPSLNWNTLQFTAVGFADNIITLPAGTQHYATTVPMTYDGDTFDVDIELGINLATGQVYARFQSIDPDTNLPPSDVLIGFLPPEDGTGRGQGYFSYMVQLKPGLATGTQISNVAHVTFDQGEVIATDQVDPYDPSQGVDPTKECLNTIDAGAPTSSVSPLPAIETSASFPVSWSGSDDTGGSGIASYNVYVSEDNGSFQPWLTGTADTSDTYTGQFGHTYGFYCIATDNVGNQEVKTPAAEATTLVQSPTSTVLTTDNPTGSTYGQAVTFTATVSGAAEAGTPTGTVQFVIDGSDFGSPVTLSGGTASIVVASLCAGTHQITGIYTTDNPATFQDSQTTTSLPQVVNPASLTISADSQTMVYGAALPTLTASYAGFVNGDTSASLTTLPTLTTTATAGSPVGSYDIDVCGAVDANYDITYVTGTLTIGPATLTWNGVSNGNWTDAQWTGSSLPYPNNMANAIVNTPYVVQVTSGQAANALAISQGGQVAVATGASLSVSTDTSVTGGGTLSVDPNGALLTGGTMTLDTGGSLSGGPVTAAAFQFNDGTASANLSGPGGLTKDTGGTVVLSGVNSYAGGTVVNAGTLIVANAGALPDGSSLTIGDGTAFDPGLAAEPLAAGFAAPAAASVTSTPMIAAGSPANATVAMSVTSTLSPSLARQVENLSFVPVAAPAATVSSAASDAVFKSYRSPVDPTVAPADNVQSARPWAWLAAIESPWNSSDQNKTTDSKVAALDKVLAQYGV